MELSTEVKVDPWIAFQEELQTELEQSQRALKEINLMFEQSQQELNKLAQKNTAVTVHLQQTQAAIDTMPRADIRMAYDAALDTQQRLFVMRGQLDKLQSDQAHLNRLMHLIEKVQGLMESGKPQEAQKEAPETVNVEMLINAQESERQRLSRQIHDGPAQALSNFILQTEIAARLFDVDPAKAKEELANLKTAAMTAFEKVRNFIFELRPMMLDDLGVVPTIRKYIETYMVRTGVEITLVATGKDHRQEPYIDVMIFRAVQELLNNAVKHGEATQIKVQFNNDETRLRLSVEDIGKGFNPIDAEKAEGFGLRLIRERVQMMGGSMMVDSLPGQGCRISFEIPIQVEQLPI